MRKLLHCSAGILAGVAATPAFAHDTALPHAHSEYAVLAIAAVALVLLGRGILKRNKTRQDGSDQT